VLTAWQPATQGRPSGYAGQSAGPDGLVTECGAAGALPVVTAPCSHARRCERQRRTGGPSSMSSSLTWIGERGGHAEQGFGTGNLLRRAAHGEAAK
jgi:hypothetical protein